MKPLNYKELKATNLKFIFIFSTLLILLFICSFFTLFVAKKGVKVLKEKHSSYSGIFESQALIVYEIDDMIKLIYSLKNKRRTINEHRQLQGLLTKKRMEIEDKIEDEQTKFNEFAVFSQLLDQVKSIQTTIDTYEQSVVLYRYNKDLLEKCREKYRKDKLGETEEM